MAFFSLVQVVLPISLCSEALANPPLAQGVVHVGHVTIPGNRDILGIYLGRDVHVHKPEEEDSYHHTTTRGYLLRVMHLGEASSAARDTQADDTPTIGARGGANCRITPGPHTQPFKQKGAGFGLTMGVGGWGLGEPPPKTPEMVAHPSWSNIGWQPPPWGFNCVEGVSRAPQNWGFRDNSSIDRTINQLL